MQNKSLLCIVILLVCLSTGYAQFNTYDRLYRTFFEFAKLPLNTTSAQSMGWSPFSNTCQPGLGQPWSPVSTGPSSTTPGFLYFTSAGQIAGLGARVFSQYVPQNLVPDFWRPVQGQSNQYDIGIIFRSNDLLCSGMKSAEVLGDRLFINGITPIPLDSKSATQQGWTEGACINEMGTHYSYDLAGSGGRMTWNSSTLLPVMPMYGVNDYQVKAILIATPSWQYTYPIGSYEGPFNNYLFCFNWCSDSGCTFSGTEVWSTFHWLFTDYKEVQCTGAKCIV